MRQIGIVTSTIILSMVLNLSCRQDIPNHATYTVTVTDEDLTASWSFSDVFEDVELIPLETNDSLLLGSVNKLICTEDYYYLSTKVHVYSFDRNGHFCKKTGERGHGHYEYVELSSFTVTDNGEILILDTPQKKIIRFDSAGNGLEEQSLEFYAMEIESLGNNVIALAGSSYEDRLILWDMSTKKRMASYLPYDKKHCIEYSPPWHKRGQSVTYFYPNDARLYYLDKNGIREEWFLDCGHRTTVEKKLVPIGYGAYVYSKESVGTTAFCETDDFALFAANCTDLSLCNFNIFYSKQTGKVRVLNNDLSKMVRASVFLDFTSSDNRFVAVEDAQILLDSLANITVHLHECGMDSLALAIGSRMSRVQPDDNPIICLFKMNSF